jgi:hypothetical protein
MNTPRDNLRAFGLSLAVHVLCVLLISAGIFWTRTEAPISVAGCGSGRREGGGAGAQAGGREGP